MQNKRTNAVQYDSMNKIFISITVNKIFTVTYNMYTRLYLLRNYLTYFFVVTFNIYFIRKVSKQFECADWQGVQSELVGLSDRVSNHKLLVCLIGCLIRTFWSVWQGVLSEVVVLSDRVSDQEVLVCMTGCTIRSFWSVWQVVQSEVVGRSDRVSNQKLLVGLTRCPIRSCWSV